MEQLTILVASISDWLWGTPLISLVMCTGIFLTIFFKGRYLTKVKFNFDNTYGKMFASDKGEGKGTVSGFAAACTALANTLGVGNIGGVATAIVSGGPGAVFWIWIADIFGVSTKACEILMGQRYRVKYEKSIDEYVSDRSFVFEGTTGSRVGGIIIALFVILFGPWTNAVQSEAVTSSIAQLIDIDMRIVLAILGISVFVTVYGGIRTIANTLEKVVPFMAIGYILAVLVITLLNFQNIPDVIVSIFKGAFSPVAAAGGFLGASMKEAIRFGIARGVYSSDTGTGYGMVAHSAAITDHPIRQSLWGWGEVMADMVICTMTALAILITQSHIKFGDITSAGLTTAAFGEALGTVGVIFMAIAITIFAWTTIVGMYYSVEKSVNYIFGDTKFNKVATRLFLLYFLVPVCLLPNIEANLLWAMTDLITGLYVILTVFLIVMNLKELKRLFNDFWERFIPAKERGENPPIVSYGEFIEK